MQLQTFIRRPAPALPPPQAHAGGIPMCVLVRPGSLPSDLVCIICSDMCDDPVITPCHHAFCKSCMANARAHSELCPIDRQPLPPSLPSLKASNPFGYRLWNGIQLRCPYAAVIDCTWSGYGEDYRAHASACKVHAESAASASKAKKAKELQALVRALEQELSSFRQDSVPLARLEQSDEALRAANAALGQANEEKQLLQVELSRSQGQVMSLGASVAELRRTMSPVHGIALDTSYSYNRFRVPELAQLILQDLERPPANVVANRIFICIRNIHADYERAWGDNPEDLAVNLAMLIGVAKASGWFTNKQYGLLYGMLQNMLPA